MCHCKKNERTSWKNAFSHVIMNAEVLLRLISCRVWKLQHFIFLDCAIYSWLALWLKEVVNVYIMGFLWILNCSFYPGEVFPWNLVDEMHLYWCANFCVFLQIFPKCGSTKYSALYPWIIIFILHSLLISLWNFSYTSLTFFILGASPPCILASGLRIEKVNFASWSDWPIWSWCIVSWEQTDTFT